MKAVKSTIAGLRDRVGGFSLPSLPTLGRTVPIPVYVVHNSDKAEDYFFIFDFEDFSEGSGQGIFVRPKLKIWSGRDDFDRAAFARQFRESFAAEFEAQRQAIADGTKKSSGWFSWVDGFAVGGLGGAAAVFAANVVLLVALSAGRFALSALLPARLLQGKSDAAKLEESISETKNQVDAALARIEVVLHRDLASHAFYGDLPDSLAGAGFDEWPLPGFVAEHLDKTEKE